VAVAGIEVHLDVVPAVQAVAVVGHLDPHERIARALRRAMRALQHGAGHSGLAQHDLRLTADSDAVGVFRRHRGVHPHHGFVDEPEQRAARLDALTDDERILGDAPGVGGAERELAVRLARGTPAIP
jgi:hypothetical protein